VGKIWEGTIEFDLAVKYAVSSGRSAEASQVEAAVQAALANAGYPLGNGATIAGPVKSVKARDKANAGRRLQAGTETFTIEVVALAPLLPAISKLVRDIDFLNAVRKALYDAGATDVKNEEYAPTHAKSFAASEMGSPYTADDVTVTPVQNPDGTWTFNVDVAAKPDAQIAAEADKLMAVDPAKLQTALDKLHCPLLWDGDTPKQGLSSGVVVRTCSGTVRSVGTPSQDGTTISWSFDMEIDPPVEVVGEVSYPSGRGSLQDVSPAPSPPPSNDGGGVIPDDEGSAQMKKHESLNGGIIFLIILLVLCFLCPLFCCCFARGRYGAGKERLFFKFKFSHSNPTFPAFYIPYEDREKMRAELYSKGSEKQDAPVLDQEHI
jgi:hypothetical protein